MRTAIVLQARMRSARLPGKALADLGGRTIIGHCLTRLAGSQLPVIVATTDRPEDNGIDAEARRYGADVFRGADEDVLGRFLAVADAHDLTEIVRATADNPATDGDGPGRLLAVRRHVAVDYVVERGLPYGTAVEVVSVDALRRSQALITDPHDREHVTSFVCRDPRFRCLRAMAPGHLRRPGLRLTVDTPEDLEFMRAVFARVDAPETAPLSAIIAAAEAHARVPAIDEMRKEA